MSRFLAIISLLLIYSTQTVGQIKLGTDNKIKIDSIEILKNWRTKETIIRQELGFDVGDFIDQGVLDTMVIRIWNIGNFAKVGYKLDTLTSGNYRLKVLAKDALTLLPILSFNGNRQDWSLTLGMSDHNFLGRNITFDLGGTMGTNGQNFNMRIIVPRQLLYKNMAINGGILYGRANNFRYSDGEKVSEIFYSRKQISGGISNPWHEDFKYRFSPDIGWSIFQHKTDSSGLSSDVPFAGNYTVNYLSVSIGESVGYIRTMRHQKDGFRANISVCMGLGLDKKSLFYYSVGLGIHYYKLFNKVIQFSSEFSTGHTSSTIPSLLFYKGATDVKGILTGEISGQSYYTAYLGWHFTYINRDWFAMEQSVYLNWGNGSDAYLNLYAKNPLYGAGTGFYFNIPMVPWLGMRLYFTYSGKTSNWFRLEI